MTAVYSDLSGKPVLITGGATGIGAAMVRAFVGQNARVAFIDINAAAGATLATETGALFLDCDLRDIPKLRQTIATAGERIGPLRVLINNAARDDRHDWQDVTPDYWDERLATNLRHQFFAAQAAAPMMRDAGGGAIVNLGSISWMLRQPGMVAYTTAKAAVEGLTRSLAANFGPWHIAVTTLTPGWVMTERQLSMWVSEADTREILQRQALKRPLVPDDIAKAALFLASENAAACTGQTLIVDGGWA